MKLQSEKENNLPQTEVDRKRVYLKQVYFLTEKTLFSVPLCAYYYYKRVPKTLHISVFFINYAVWRREGCIISDPSPQRGTIASQ